MFMKRILFNLLLIILIYGCNNHNPYNCTIDEEITHFNDSIINDNLNIPNLNNILSVYGESPMIESASKTYRLSVSYSLIDKEKSIYKVQKTEKGSKLTIKHFYHEYDNFNDTIIEKHLSEKEWEELENCINTNCYWTMPVTDFRHGLDGWTYLLEAFDPKSENPTQKVYHFITRWAPEKGTPFRKICNKFELYN